MIVSHWGIFPGWFEPVACADGSFPIKGGAKRWRPVDWETFCGLLDHMEETEQRRTAELRRRRSAFLWGC